MKGKTIIFLSVLMTLSLYVLSKTNPGMIIKTPWLSLSQILSLVGTTLLCFSFILGSRAQFLENWFGGLDKVNKNHYIVGGLSFLMLIHHPLLLALNALPDFDSGWKFLYISSDTGYNYGVLALYGMIFVLLFTLIVKLPYDVWLKSHDLFGVTLILASLHIFMIKSDVSRYLPLRIWMFILLAIAIYFFVYKVVLYRWLGPKYKYNVEKIKQLGEILEIYLKPKDRGLSFLPGQFGYVNFGQTDLEEPHPFSFSSSPDEQLLRFSVKTLGDYTLKLKELKVGSDASVWGAYGRMFSKFGGKKDVVCISGGIGITPFLSMLRYESDHQIDRKIHLFHSARSQADASYDEEIKSYEPKLSNLKYYLILSEQRPRLTVEDIVHETGNPTDKVFYLCGPKPMMESMIMQLKDKGVNDRNIIFEEFGFKP